MLKVNFVIAALLFIVLPGCVRTVESPAQTPIERPDTGVVGQVITTMGELPEQVWIYAYGSAGRGFRGPADFAIRAEKNGAYLLDLLPGQWHLVARARPDDVTGPPRSGELWAVYDENPITLSAGEVLEIDFQLQAAASQLLSPRGEMVVTSSTGFTGLLLGPDEKPVSRAIALAYRSKDLKRMPDFRSAEVGPDGRFTLFVKKPGRYCLAARQSYRGQLRQGELYGVLGKSESGCRVVEEGDMIDVGKIHLAPYLR